jgi:hypothetical protein
MPASLQETIHKLELGSGYRYVKFAAGLIAMVALAVFYDAAAFKNLSAPEAMDAAQLARNIADGQGYSTSFVRPLSMHLVFRSVTNRLADLQPDEQGRPTHAPTAEQSRLIRLIHLEEPHPDLANPPVYPLLLAGWLKLLPFDYAAPATGQSTRIYRPDLWIAFLNQALFVLAGVMLFGLARKLFDEPVAWVSVAVLFGAELFWRFSISGLSTVLLVALLLGVVRALAGLDQTARGSQKGAATGGGPLEAAAQSEAGAAPPQAGLGKLIALAVTAGALVGVAGLTRYSFGWLIIPVVLFVATVPSRQRGLLAGLALAAFLVVMTPWTVRNLSVSGTPFGTAGYAAVQGTSLFPDDQLERTLDPNFSLVSTSEYWRKLEVGVQEILQNSLPKLGGSWVTAFFLAGLLVPFRSPTLRRLRWFLVGSLALFVIVQAVGRTQLTTDSPEINSENLLAVFAPVAFMYGVGLFFVLLDQLALPIAIGRFLLVGVFCLVSSLPLVFLHLSPPQSALSYPPYFPAGIQDKSEWLSRNDLCMTDLPWATAWYGRQQSVWLSLEYRSKPTGRRRNDFWEINDRIKPVRGLYLSTRTMKTVESETIWEYGFFVEQSDRTGGNASEADANWRWKGGPATGDWAEFILQTLIKRQVPTGFPLRSAPRGVVPELFLTDSERPSRKTI